MSRRKRGKKRQGKKRKRSTRMRPRAARDEFEHLGVRVRREGKHVLWETTERFDRERMAAQFAERSKEASAIFDQLRDQLVELLGHVSPLHLIMQVAAWATAGIPDVDDAAERLGLEAQVEYLGGLALSLQDRPIELANPAAVQTGLSLLGGLFEAEQERLTGAEFAAAGKATDPPEALEGARFVLLLEQLLDRTQGYVQHLELIVEALFEPVREECIEQLGFCPGDLPKIVRAHVENRQAVFNGRLEKARQVPKEQLEGLAVSAGWALMSWAIFGLADPTGDVTAEELAQSAGLPLTEVDGALEALVSDWGGQPDFLHPSHKNRFRRYPVLRGEAGRYSIPLPWSIIHEAIPWFVDFLRTAGREQLLNSFYRARSDVSEDLVARIFINLFGADRVFRNVEYPIPGQNWAEVDLLVGLGKHVLVVETKSHGISDEYRAGDLDRARFHFSDLVETPFQQSHRAAEYLAGGGDKLREKGTQRRIDWQPVDAVTRIAVSLERIDPLVMVAAQVVEGKEGTPPAWALCLSDLFMIADILPTPHEFFAYVSLRSEMAANPVSALISEADALGAFLHDRLRDYRGILARSNVNVASLTHHAQDLNAYYSADAGGLSASKPRLILREGLIDELNRLYQEGSPEWSDRAVRSIA